MLKFSFSHLKGFHNRILLILLEFHTMYFDYNHFLLLPLTPFISIPTMSCHLLKKNNSSRPICATLYTLVCCYPVDLGQHAKSHTLKGNDSSTRNYQLSFAPKLG